MQWLNPTGAWAFLGLAAVLALYMLRREYQEKEISSTYLWRRALRDQTASRPFQKLKSSLLMVLQLLLVALTALSLMRPVAPGQALGGETVMIFDISASMQATENGRSRMEQAVAEAVSMVSTMAGAQRLTILAAGDQVSQTLTRSTDRQAALSALNGLKARNGGADINGALSLAQAMRREIGELEVIVYSDDFISPPGMDLMYISVGSGADNCAIVSLNAAERDGGPKALVQVANYGAAQNVPVECYADGQLCDVRALSIPEGGTQSVSFTLPAGTRHVKAVLSLQDAMASDNSRDFLLQQGKQSRVAIAGQDNVFLEKALAQRADAEIVRTTAQDAPLLPPCDLYVFDGVMPDLLPAQGAFLFFKPAKEVLGVTPGPEKAAKSSLRLSSSGLSASFQSHVALKNTALRQYMPLLGGEALLLCGDDTVASAGEFQGSRFVVIGFDLHDTNWVVQYDFPIFMMHVFEYLLPNALSGVENALCGEAVQLVLSSKATSAQVITPAGRRVALAPPFPALPLADTGEAGVYTLKQTLTEGEAEDIRFAVNMPLGESDVRNVSPGTGVNQRHAGTVAYGVEWTWFLVLALLIISMLEWWVSCRAG